MGVRTFFYHGIIVGMQVWQWGRFALQLRVHSPVEEILWQSQNISSLLRMNLPTRKLFNISMNSLTFGCPNLISAAKHDGFKKSQWLLTSNDILDYLDFSFVIYLIRTEAFITDNLCSHSCGLSMHYFQHFWLYFFSKLSRLSSSMFQ